MRTHQLLLLPALLLGLAAPAFAQEAWHKAHDDDGIVVYTRESAQGFVEYKAQTTLNASLQQVAAVLADKEGHTDWMYNIDECRELTSNGPKDVTYYYVVHMPWPLNNRDLVSRNTWQVKHNGTVLLSMESQPEGLPETDYDRLQFAEGYWLLMPQGPNMTKVEYQYNADPGMSVPGWLLDMFIVDGPVETIENLREQLTKEQYQEVQLSWLQP